MLLLQSFALDVACILLSMSSYTETWTPVTYSLGMGYGEELSP
jgi:hypothetical protein